MTDIAAPDFDPASKLRQLRGRGGGEAEYLDVKWRVKWFRELWPTGQIVTEHIEISDVRAVFRATARKTDADGTVHGTATGYGSETAGDFGDFIEKAETKAIGRALNALGYGTTEAVAGRDDDARIVDAPVERPTAVPARQPGKPIGAGTIKHLFAAATDKGLDESKVRYCAFALYQAESVKHLADHEGQELAGRFERLAPVEAEYLGRLIAALDLAALETAGEAMKAGGVGNDFLRSVYKRKQRAFNAAG